MQLCWCEEKILFTKTYKIFDKFDTNAMRWQRIFQLLTRDDHRNCEVNEETEFSMPIPKKYKRMINNSLF
jgi:hypothetical protein